MKLSRGKGAFASSPDAERQKPPALEGFRGAVASKRFFAQATRSTISWIGFGRLGANR
jgi:hypothetical protein